MFSDDVSARSWVTLSDLSRRIAMVMRQQFSHQRIWIVAEITNIKLSGGHCYLQLSEKDEVGGLVKAEFRAIMWREAYQRLHSRFQQETGGTLKENLQILCCVEVNYHERYGLSLVIHDLDASYTLGQIELQRRQIVARLKESGLYDLNKQQHLNEVVQRIAVISAEDSRGFEDFMIRLQENPYGYSFHVRLYPALLQGEKAAQDIIQQLRAIQRHQNKENFDAVVIVRGGGAASSLGCFNDELLSREIASYPLPVLTGIGHMANRSIVDEVAHSALITPTDVGVFLVNRVMEFEQTILQLREELMQMAGTFLSTENDRIDEYSHTLVARSDELLREEDFQMKNIVYRLRNESSRELLEEKHQIELFLQQSKHLINTISDRHHRELSQKTSVFPGLIRRLLERENAHLEKHESVIKHLDPQQVLKRGYSLTLHQGKPLTSTQSLRAGDEIKTILAEGEITSTVNTTSHV